MSLYEIVQAHVRRNNILYRFCSYSNWYYESLPKKMFFLPFLRACLSAGFVGAERKRLSTCEIVYVCVCVWGNDLLSDYTAALEHALTEGWRRMMKWLCQEVSEGRVGEESGRLMQSAFSPWKCCLCQSVDLLYAALLPAAHPSLPESMRECMLSTKALHNTAQWTWREWVGVCVKMWICMWFCQHAGCVYVCVLISMWDVHGESERHIFTYKWCKLNELKTHNSAQCDYRTQVAECD